MRYERGSRIRSAIPAAVVAGDDRHEATLVDFSKKGARVKGVQGIVKDTVVRVEVRGLADTLAGTIAWTAGDEAGITFLTALAEKVAERLLGLVEGREGA